MHASSRRESNSSIGEVGLALICSSLRTTAMRSLAGMSLWIPSSRTRWKKTLRPVPVAQDASKVDILYMSKVSGRKGGTTSLMCWIATTDLNLAGVTYELGLEISKWVLMWRCFCQSKGPRRG